VSTLFVFNSLDCFTPAIVEEGKNDPIGTRAKVVGLYLRGHSGSITSFHPCNLLLDSYSNVFFSILPYLILSFLLIYRLARRLLHPLKMQPSERQAKSRRLLNQGAHLETLLMEESRR